MAWNNPLGRERVLEVIGLAGLEAGDRVVDAGCGSGELLASLDNGLVRTGIELESSLVEMARERDPEVSWVVGDAANVPLPADVALAMCVGSTHAFGTGPDALENAVRHLGASVRPRGHLLIGEGYQKRPLAEGYAALLGTPSGIERTHLENVQAIEAMGWTCVHAITASEAEWDAFEWAFFRRKGQRAWRDAYLRWGRDTMGFGLYLARKTA